MARDNESISVHRGTIWLAGQELGRNVRGTLVARRCGEEACAYTSLNGQKR